MWRAVLGREAGAGQMKPRGESALVWRAKEGLFVPGLMKHVQAPATLSRCTCCQLDPYQSPSHPLQKFSSSPSLTVHVASSKLFPWLRQAVTSSASDHIQVSLRNNLKLTDALLPLILHKIMIGNKMYLRSFFPLKKILCLEYSFCSLSP